MEKQYPFYLKTTVILFGLVLAVYIFKNLTDILLPLAFASIIAILLNPLVNKLNRQKINLVVSISGVMLIAILILAAIFYFLSSQIIGLTDNLPVLKERFIDLSISLQSWINEKFGIAVNKQVQLINEGLNNSKELIGSTLTTAAGTLAFLFLIPVYIFLLLFYKRLILNFLYQIFAEKNSQKVADILNQTKGAIQSFMVGLMLEAAVVAVLNTTALLIIGVKYAVLLGVLGAFLNILPYIGGIIAIALPVLMATVTNTGFASQFWVIAAYVLIQFIDNNILVPRIVSSKVQLNALISVIGILLGGALWGFSGMFLSIPFLAILKIIFDRIDGLKPWGELLGVEIPTTLRTFKFQRSKKPSIAEKLVER